MINGMTHLAITKLDVLDAFDEVRAATSYELDGKTIERFPGDSNELARSSPVYESLPGWDTPVRESSSWEDLPAPAKRYLDFISEYV
jgi:adenylosuccinate synthase